MRDFKKIIAWQKAHRISVAVHYSATRANFDISPGLRSQLLRAVSAVPANISEGSGARTDSEFARYLDIALKSAREVENHLICARDLQCIPTESCDELIADLDEVRRILFAFARGVRSRAGESDRR
jgi:four helix bundle protein